MGVPPPLPPASSGSSSSSSSGRARKPPAKRNADRTRERILQAAITAFSEHGYSGARIDAICRSARANSRMLYAYFGDKERLYIFVLEHVIGELRHEELKLEVDHVDPFEGMMQLFEFMQGHFADHPELIALLSGENLLGGRFLRGSSKVPLITSPLLPLVERLLRRGERQGLLRSGLDPLHLYVLMVALCYFHRSNAHTLSTIFATDLLAPAWQAQHEKMATDMLARFLRPR